MYIYRSHNLLFPDWFRNDITCDVLLDRIALYFLIRFELLFHLLKLFHLMGFPRSLSINARASSISFIPWGVEFT